MKRSWEGLEINPLILGDCALWYCSIHVQFYHWFKILTQLNSLCRKFNIQPCNIFTEGINLKSLCLLTCKMFTVVLRKLLIFFCYWSWSTISENQKDSFKHESIIFVSCPTNRQKEKEKYSPLNHFLGLTPKYFFMDI